MRQVAFIDLETSGLIAGKNQVLELAMVKFDHGMIRHDAALHIYIDHPYITYQLDALKKFGDRIKDRKPGVPVMDLDTVQSAIRHWFIYEMNTATAGKCTLGGKNVGSFDVPFLQTIFPDLNQFIRHRFVDVGNKYMKSNDTVLPDLETCRQRAVAAGVTGRYVNQEVTHTALEDAALSAELFQGWYNGLLGKEYN